MSIRRTFWGVIFLIAAAYAGAILIPDDPPGAKSDVYYLIVYFGILLVAVSWVWTQFAVRGLEVRRTARGLRQQLGQIFEERFEIINRLPIVRVWLEVRNLSDLPGTQGSRVFSWVSPREVRSYTTYTLLTRRGEFLLGPTEIYAGDPFGLFLAKKEIVNHQRLLVLPYMVKLKRFPFPPGILPGGRPLRLKSKQTTPHAAGVREYASGDALNRIHWPSTARRDRMMVKEFEQDPLADVYIIMDSQKLAHASLPNPEEEVQIDKIWMLTHKHKIGLPPSSFEYTASIAASVARYFVQKGLAVGFASAGQLFTFLPAERTERQLGKILETLAFLKPAGDLPLPGLVETQLQHLPRGSVVVIITASSHEMVAHAAEALNYRQLKPVVILVDASSFGGTGGTEHLTGLLHMRRIPVTVVRNGVDLEAALEGGFGR